MGIWVPWLADAARMTGFPVILAPGYAGRGHKGFRALEGVAGHHTATSAKARGDYPSERIVTVGRSDLPGPLCNYGLGRSGAIYVIAAGVGWHAGASQWAGFRDLNDEFLGIEAESPGYGEWTDAQRDAYPRLVAACLHFMRRDASRYAGHKDICIPRGRKPDPRGIDTRWMQDTVRSFGNDPARIRRGGASGGPINMAIADDMMNLIRDYIPSGGGYTVVLPASPNGESTVKVGIPPVKGWTVGNGSSAVALFGGGGRTFIRSVAGVEDWTNNGKADGKRHGLRGAYDLVGRDTISSGEYGASTYIEVTYLSEQPMSVFIEYDPFYGKRK